MRHSARINRPLDLGAVRDRGARPASGRYAPAPMVCFGTHGWVPGHSVVKPSPKPEHNVSTCNDGETLFEAGRNNDVSCPNLNK